MQKKSHNRKFQVGQLVKVLSTPTTDHEHSCVIKLVGKSYEITDYKNNEGLNYRLRGHAYWFSAKELEAVQEETPEDFFEEKETDGPVAQVLLQVLERLPVDEENDTFTSQYTCDIIGDIVVDLKSEKDKITDFLDTLGFESSHSGFSKFSEFEEGFERQSARFNWILFALQVAREEGV